MMEAPVVAMPVPCVVVPCVVVPCAVMPCAVMPVPSVVMPVPSVVTAVTGVMAPVVSGAVMAVVSGAVMALVSGAVMAVVSGAVMAVSVEAMRLGSSLLERAHRARALRLPGGGSRRRPGRLCGRGCRRAGPAHAPDDLADQPGVTSVGGTHSESAEPTLEHGHRLAVLGRHPHRSARREWARENAGPGGW
jgi:hypothetical protein